MKSSTSLSIFMESIPNAFLSNVDSFHEFKQTKTY